MLRSKLVLLLILLVKIGYSQVGVNTSSPHESAQLHVKSDDKGVLIPKMDKNGIQNISNPAQGLMVFDTVRNSFYQYDGARWISVGGFILNDKASDAVTDTLKAEKIVEFEEDVDFKEEVDFEEEVTFEEEISIESTIDSDVEISTDGSNFYEGEFKGFGIMPVGSIVMYHNSINKTQLAQKGWALCDGQQVTLSDGSTFTPPDLRGLFIVGAGNGNSNSNGDANSNGNYSLGNNGGEKKHSLSVDEMPSHNHGGSTTGTGNHTHTYTDQHRNTTSDGGGGGLATRASGGMSTNTRTITSSGSHDHTIPSQGSGDEHENRPPYYAMYYIIRVE